MTTNNRLVDDWAWIHTYVMICGCGSKVTDRSVLYIFLVLVVQESIEGLTAHWQVEGPSDRQKQLLEYQSLLDPSKLKGSGDLRAGRCFDSYLFGTETLNTLLKSSPGESALVVSNMLSASC